MRSHKDSKTTMDFLNVFPEDRVVLVDPAEYTDSGFRLDRYTDPSGRRVTDDSWRYDGE
jgi:hypothetical protein